MTTQLMVKIDAGLKERVAKKAKAHDMTLSDLVKMALRAYDEDRIEPGIMLVPERFNAKTRREITKALKDIKFGRNLSPRFNNLEEAINYLDDLK